MWMMQCNLECNANYHGYIGFAETNATKCIFLNHRPIHCPFILKLIGICFKKSLDLSLYQDIQSLQDKNMFILFFFTLSQNEYTFVNENGKQYVLFYNMQEILNGIKNFIFKCLAEKTPVNVSNLYNEPLLKQMCVKPEKSILNNDINKYNVCTMSLIKKHKIIDFKKKKIKSEIVIDYSSKRHNKSDDAKTTSYTDKKNSILNETQYQVDIASMVHTKLCKDEITVETSNNIDEIQKNSTKLASVNSTESDKLHNFHDDDDFININSPLSEWSDWTYCTKIRDESMKNVDGTFSKNGTRLQQLFGCNKQFDFLPRKLHGLLQHRRKLTNVKCSNSPDSTIPCKCNLKIF